MGGTAPRWSTSPPGGTTAANLVVDDARFLRSAGVLPAERIRAVETGACPHTAIVDDITMNLLAVEDLARDHAPLDVVLLESGGDNLTATFSPGSPERTCW